MKVKVQTTVDTSIADYLKTIKTTSDVVRHVLADFYLFTNNSPGLDLFDSPVELNNWVLQTTRAMFRNTPKSIKGVFNHEELGTMIAIMNSTILTPGMPGVTLLGNLEDMLPSEGPFGLDRNDLDEIVKKYKALGEFERAYLELWARSYWYAPGFETREKCFKEYISKLTA